jgi:hypothetical protein
MNSGRIVRGSFIAVVIFTIAAIMTRQLETVAPAVMGVVLFGMYLVSDWLQAQKRHGEDAAASKSAVSALSSNQGGAIAGIAFVIGAVVIAVAFFGLKSVA